ncbi:hypothetical protein SAMN05660649_05083 [Desulfotomaculum arcticum]|uniref:Uncharacterized protein n=1 Tax=Desulfotruncus arcticus DSM 17038 TaxID=1121424 RepID=A0A1I2ZRT9_9FIRM|nr:hypothetical protein SAMN05660649_05083 [Desulfotomaculum arcticum] [Desulfotruncus arcticus DSM 17038]
MSSTSEKRRKQKRINELGTLVTRCEICQANDLPALTKITL